VNSAVLTGHELSFRYRQRGEAVLRRCGLTIGPQDRILLEGPSGGGKSTLASLLIGLRRPESGLLLLHGYDQQTVGADAWRRQVVAAPQFHENHVLTETFLQGAELIILDESFAALDPETMRRALRCVLERAPALLVIENIEIRSIQVIRVLTHA
jgi:ABC-type bacteriocin/lantibiotic exporter with double-glycine peptidase domain